MDGVNDDLGEGAVLQRHFPSRQLQQHNAKRPDVCRLIVPADAANVILFLSEERSGPVVHALCAHSMCKDKGTKIIRNFHEAGIS